MYMYARGGGGGELEERGRDEGKECRREGGREGEEQVVYARTLEVWVFFTVLLSFATHVLSCILAGAWPSISQHVHV